MVTVTLEDERIWAMRSFNDIKHNRSQGSRSGSPWTSWLNITKFRHYEPVSMYHSGSLHITRFQCRFFPQWDDIRASERTEYPSRQFVLVWDAEGPVTWGEWLSDWVTVWVFFIFTTNKMFSSFIRKKKALEKVIRPSRESTERRVAYKNVFTPLPPSFALLFRFLKSPHDKKDADKSQEHVESWRVFM